MTELPGRYLALGDSYTIGEGVAAAHRWPARLVALLREAGAAVEDPEIVARTGWTCDSCGRQSMPRVPAVRTRSFRCSSG